MTKQKKCKNSCAVACNTRGLVVGTEVSSKIKSKSYTKRDQLTSSAHDPAIRMSWRVLLEEFRKLRKVMLLPRGFLNEKQNNQSNCIRLYYPYSRRSHRHCSVYEKSTKIALQVQPSL